MDMRTLFAIVFILFFFQPCWAASSEMTLSVQEDLSVVVTIDSGESLDVQTRAIVESDEVKSKYRDIMVEVFGSAEELSLVTNPTFVMSFRSDQVNGDGGKYVLEEKDFSGKLDEVSVLSVELPPGYRYVSSGMAPDSVDGNVLVWEDMTRLPEVNFESAKAASARDSRKMVAGLLLLIFTGAFVVWKLKRKPITEE